MRPDGGDRDGPLVKIVKTVECVGCRHLLSKYYSIEDGNDYDSGYTYACSLTKTSEGWNRQVLDERRTPEWCPFLRGDR